MQDSWAICRIFKKTNSTSQRTLSQSWVSPLPETATAAATNATVKSSYNNDTTFSPSDFLPYKPNNPVIISKPGAHQLPNIPTGDLTSDLMFSPFEPTIPAVNKCNIDVLLNMSSSSSMLGRSQDQCSVFSTTALPDEMQAVTNIISNGDHHEMKNQSMMMMMMMNHFGESSVRSVGFPFNLEA